MKKVVILLGAGAAIPFGGPKTSEITEAIKTDVQFTVEGKPVGEILYDLLCKYFRGYGKEVNFETMLHALETIYDFVRMRNQTGAVRPIFNSGWHILFELKEVVSKMVSFEVTEAGEEFLYFERNGCGPDFPPNDNPKGHAEMFYFGNLLKHFYFIVDQEIQGYNFKNEEPAQQPIASNLQSFLMYLIEIGYIPRIYTLNYDNLIPNLCPDLNTFNGFDMKVKGSSDLLGCSIKKVITDQVSSVYYNLHGSPYWTYSFSHDTSRGKVCFDRGYCGVSFGEGIEERANPGSEVQLSNIITGYNKSQRISLNPFGLFYNAFQRDAIEAEAIIVAGYSYSDFHINRVLANGLQIEGSPKPMLHIDYLQGYDRIKGYF